LAENGQVNFFSQWEHLNSSIKHLDLARSDIRYGIETYARQSSLATEPQPLPPNLLRPKAYLKNGSLRLNSIFRFWGLSWNFDWLKLKRSVQKIWQDLSKKLQD